MNISLHTLRSLDANKSYYVANSTGEITEATAWQKFKCFLGIGDGRAKAAKVVDAVKNALLDASGKITDKTLDDSINSFESGRSRFFSVSGRDIAQLAANFTVANEEDIARVRAGHLARQPLFTSVDNVRSYLRLESDNLDDIRAVLEKAAKPLIDDPPMKTDGSGRRTIDEDTFKKELSKVLDDAEQAIVDVSKAGPGGRIRFDGVVRDAMFATLYGPDGKRNDKTADDMPSISELRFKKVMDNVINYKPHNVTKDEFAAFVRALIDKCGDDPVMLDAIEYEARRFLVTGDSKMRSHEIIGDRVTNYKDNMRELMDVAGGNRIKLDAAHMHAERFSGVVLPKGAYIKVMEEVNAVDLTPFEGLGADSDCMDIHNAILELNKAVRNILSKSGVLKKLNGQDETAAFRIFLQNALISRLSKADLRGISAALSTPMAAMILKFYSDSGFRNDELVKHIPESIGLFTEVKDQLNMLVNYMNEFKQIVEKALGRETLTPINTEDAKRAKKEDFFGGDILDSVKDYSTEVLTAKREEYLNGVVTGKSAAAQKIRGLFADLIGPAPHDPANEVCRKVNLNTKCIMNHSVMYEAKKIMLDDISNSVFARDIKRGIDVTLDGVGKLSKDLNTALDQIAHFVTGNANARFNTLDSVMKTKAAIVIGTIGQESVKAIMSGCGFALNPKGDATALDFPGNDSNDKKVYQLSLGSDGELVIGLSHTEKRSRVLVNGEVMEVSGGITVEADLTYKISAEELKRLSELDLAAYDETAPEAEFNAIGENGIYENRIEKMFDKIPKQYRINAKCVTSYSVKVHDFDPQQKGNNVNDTV